MTHRPFAGAAVLILGALTLQGLPARGEADHLRDLATLEELQARFEADRGRTRLVLLLSPT